MIIGRTENKKREIELDLLRIIALLAVISVHCTGMGSADDLPVNDFYRKLLIFFDAIATWQIPVFVMISGRFFLDPERKISSGRLKKAIFRLIVAFIFWNIIYQVYYIFHGYYAELNWKGILLEAIKGPYHFWYIYMLVFLYAITPFLRIIVQDKKLTEYYITLFFVFEFLQGYGVDLPVIGNYVSEILTNINFHFAIGFSGYYVLGYYIYRYKETISKRREIILYCVGIFLLLFVGWGSVYRAVLDGYYGEWYTGYLKPNTIIVAGVIFLFFTKRISQFKFSEKAKRWISKLSELSFGVYLIHALLIELLALTGISSVIWNPIIIHPLIVIASFAFSSVCVSLLRKIPVIGVKIT